MDRKQEILNVALDEFTQAGFSGARLQAIADKTGVTKAMIHYYFKTKKGLFQQAFRAVCDDLITDLFQPLEQKFSLFSKIDAFIDKTINRFSRQPKRSQFLVDALNKHPELTVEIFREYYKCDLSVLNEQLKAASENYEIAPVSSDQLIANIMALSVFPSTEHIFLKEILNKNDEQYDDLLANNHGTIKDTIINWITG